MKPITLKFEKVEVIVSMCWLSKYLSPQNRNILGGVYGKVQVTAPDEESSTSRSNPFISQSFYRTVKMQRNSVSTLQ
jgi:hypothetical protein